MALARSIQWDHPNPFFHSKLFDFIGNRKKHTIIQNFHMMKLHFAYLWNKWDTFLKEIEAIV